MQRVMQARYAGVTELGVHFVLRFAPQRQSARKGLSALHRQRYRAAPRIRPIADRNQMAIAQQEKVSG